MSPSVGIDLGGTNIKIGLVDQKGKVLFRRRLATDLERSPHELLARIARVVHTWQKKTDIRSIGVGIAGLVDHRNGVLSFSPNLPSWKDIPVKEIIYHLTGIEAFCANDANAVALGEWLYGAGQGYKNILCITLGTGVGTGIITHNRLLVGANHFAGELGHTQISLKGPICPCGNRGCLERYVGAKAIVNRARRLLRKKSPDIKLKEGDKEGSKILELIRYDIARLSPKEIGIAAKKGDKLALKVVNETGYILGRGIYNAIMLLDPEIVILGGGISRIGRLLLKKVEETIFRRMYGPKRQLKITLSQLGDDAGIIGASQLSKWLPNFLRED